jgi:hypothetical protein
MTNNSRKKDSSSSSFDLESKAKKKKYVTLKVLTTLHQQDLNQFIEHLRQSQDFHFMVKSEVFYPLEIKEEDKKDQKKDGDNNSSSISSSLLCSNRVISVLSVT